MIAVDSAARMFQAAAALTAAEAAHSECDILFSNTENGVILLMTPFFAEKCNFFNIYHSL